MSVNIIAEIGVNHNGDMGKALDLIDAAADAGVDFVKFQTFRAEKLLAQPILIRSVISCEVNWIKVTLLAGSVA